MIRLTVVLFSAIAAAYAVGAYVFPYEFTTRDVLHQLYTLTGMMLWTLMTLCLVAAARPRWIERFTGTGLNQVMAMHKVLGWGVTAFLGLHIAAPLFGMLIPATPVPLMGHHDMSTLWQKVWIISHPVCAFGGVLVTFWILTLIVKDIRRARGKLAWSGWEAKHRAWAWGYVLMAPHCLRLLKETEMVMPLGWINLLVTVVGLWAAVRIIRRRVGIESRQAGTVFSVESYPSHTWLTVKTPAAQTVAAGGFVYLSRPGDTEDPHPFSVAAIDKAAGTLSFWIRPAGDWTKGISQWNVGSDLTVEGPWGDFVLTKEEGQLWAAAGSGIAPFLSWLEERSRRVASREKLPSASLFWCIHSVKDETGLTRVKHLAQTADVTLKIFVTEQENRRPTAADLGVEKARTLSVCGPAGFVAFTRQSWQSAGKSRKAFRAETF